MKKLTRRLFILSGIAALTTVGGLYGKWFTGLFTSDDKKSVKTGENTSNSSAAEDTDPGFEVFNELTQKNMEAFAETLVPGSGEIKIKKLFMDNIKKEPGLQGFLDAGLWNLEALAASMFSLSFYELKDKSEIEKVVTHLSKSNPQFFGLFKRKIVELYYSHPEVLKELNYQGPPQPRGFMNYTKPPEKV